MQDNGNTIAIETVEEGEQLQSAAAGYVVLGFEFALVLYFWELQYTSFLQKEKNQWNHLNIV